MGGREGGCQGSGVQVKLAREGGRALGDMNVKEGEGGEDHISFCQRWKTGVQTP